MSWKRDLAACAVSRSGVSLLLRKARRRQGILSLIYHRIGEGQQSPFDRGLWSATPEAFDAQVRLLKEQADIIGPGDLKDVWRRNRGLYVLITFDDGYRDNYLQAFPILRGHGASATFFVATGFLDRPHLAWWDEIAWMIRTSRRRWLPPSPWLNQSVQLDEPQREGAVEIMLSIYKKLPGAQTQTFLEWLAEETGSGRSTEDASGQWMTWEMLREMAASGMWIGGHTVNHPILARLPRGEQSAEIAGCRQRIEAELEQPMQWFSYPRGKSDAFNQETIACLREQGVELAFSNYGGIRRYDDWDPYDVRRVPVERDVTLNHLGAVMALPEVFA